MLPVGTRKRKGRKSNIDILWNIGIRIDINDIIFPLSVSWQYQNSILFYFWKRIVFHTHCLSTDPPSLNFCRLELSEGINCCTLRCSSLLGSCFCFLNGLILTCQLNQNFSWSLGIFCCIFEWESHCIFENHSILSF